MIAIDRVRVPAGQPRAYPRTRTHTIDGFKLPKSVYPHQVTFIRTREDLLGSLKHYSHPFPMMDGARTPKNKHARRYQIEWVFPALRWFCHVYSHQIPDWLKNRGWAEGISDKDHKRFLGEGELDISEWKEDKKHAGSRA